MLRLIFSVLVLFPSLVYSADFKTGENVQVSGEYNDSVFATGSTVTADLFSSDDVYLAGGKVIFTGRTSESLWCAGGDLSVLGGSARDAVLASGNITINGSDLRDLTVAGGKVNIQNTEIRDDLLGAAGELTLDSRSRVNGSLTVTGGVVTIDGFINGDAQVYANILNVGPTAIINGDLNHTAKKVLIADGAKVYGVTKALATQGTSPSGIFWVISLLLVLGSTLVVPLLVTFFPNIATTASKRIRFDFLRNLGRGTLVAFAVPLAMLLLMISVIGIPVVFFSIPLLLLAALLAWTYGVCALTSTTIAFVLDKELNSLSKVQQFLSVTVGTLGCVLLSSISLVGFVFMTLLMFSGFGALEDQLSTNFNSKSKRSKLNRPEPTNIRGADPVFE